MVVRFDRNDQRFPGMSQMHEQVRPLPVFETAKEMEGYEILERMAPMVAEKYFSASQEVGARRRLLFAEANDMALRGFVRTRVRDLLSISNWFGKVRRNVEARAKHSAEMERGVISEERNVELAQGIIQEMHGREQSIYDLLGNIDGLRKTHPGEALFTGVGVDVHFGADLLRASGFSWDAAAGTLEVDLVAYQAKAGRTTPEERRTLARDYGRNFEVLKNAMRPDTDRLLDLSGVEDRDLSHVSMDDLLELATGSASHLRAVESHPSLGKFDDLKRFAHRVRVIDRTNAFARAERGIQMLAPAARIRSVEGRLLVRDENGAKMNISFQDALKSPRSPEPEWYDADAERRARKNRFLRNKDEEAL